MLKKHLFSIFVIIALIYIVADSVFSYKQFGDFCLDSDISNISVPCKAYSTILENPLGLSIFTNHDRYAATNRFFLHWSSYLYFNKMPLFLQSLGVNPISSVYMAFALLKLFSQLIYVLILSLIVKQLTFLHKLHIPFIAVLFLCLFQTNGYDGQMGLIDKSISYFFSYGLPILVFLLYLYPYVYYFSNKKTLGNKWVNLFLLLILSYIIPFQGSLMCGIISVFLFTALILIFTSQYKKNGKFSDILLYFKNLPIELTLPLIVIGIFSLYSFYLGTFNAENDWVSLSITERYKRLPMGLFLILTKRLGFPILIIISLINSLYIIKNAPDETVERFKTVLKSLALFSLLYLLFLPLGGYRSYREYIIRFDTFIPVTICIFIFYVYSSVTSVQIASAKVKIIFIAMLAISVAIFTIADCKREYQNSCEKTQLLVLSKTKSNAINLRCDCTVFNWIAFSDYDRSKESAIMLYRWHVTDHVILYKTIADN